MGKNDNYVPFIIAFCTIAVIVVYAFLKMMVVFGGILLIVAFALSLIGMYAEDNRFFAVAALALFIGLSFMAIGNEGIEFLEENPTGKNVLDAANTVVNVTEDSVDKYQKISNFDESLTQTSLNQIQGA